MKNNFKKSYLFTALLFTSITFVSCNSTDSDSGEDSNGSVETSAKQKMRQFVRDLSKYAKDINSDFAIIPQNGHELMRKGGDEDGAPMMEYINSIDGAGQEDLFYGYDDDNEATPKVESDYLLSFLNAAKDNGKKILVTDYCWTESKIDDSYSTNSSKGFISYAAAYRDLDRISPYPDDIYNENSNDINSLSDAKNFLYLIDPGQLSSPSDLVDLMKMVNYDVVLIDAFDMNDDMLSASNISEMKRKKNGGKRLVISYMSIGEAEDYRYYWKSDWENNAPSWLDAENPDWPGNYKVKYWEKEWQDIIFGNNDSYLKKILDAGFDGVYLDIIEAFEYYE